MDGSKDIWVASDGFDSVDEFRIHAPSHVPNVLIKPMVYVAEGVIDVMNTRGVNPFPTKQICFTALGKMPYYLVAW